MKSDKENLYNKSCAIGETVVGGAENTVVML